LVSRKRRALNSSISVRVVAGGGERGKRGKRGGKLTGSCKEKLVERVVVSVIFFAIK
jgi:hypothetical protein